MSYAIGPDGETTFTCRGCGKEVKSRSLKTIPKGWCISGILGNIPDPETIPPEYEAATAAEALQIALNTLCDHFCGNKCGKKFLMRDEVVKRVHRLGIVLVLWGQCTLVVDGSLEPAAKAEFKDDKGKKHVDKEGKEKPGSPPPFELGDGKSPI